MVLTGSGGATAVAANPNSALTNSTAVTMAFDSAGNAPFSFNYSDVGQVTLSASATVNSAALAGSSNAFVVKPGGFAIGSIRQTAVPNGANPAAASAGGPKFLAAGEAFSATITAQTSTGATTPNYGRETAAEGVRLTSTLLLPAGL